MPRLIDSPGAVPGAGNASGTVAEFVGRTSTGQSHVSVMRVEAPGGWKQRGQRPEFEEIVLVLKGMLRVEHEAGQFDVKAGQAVITTRGEWVRYSAPESEGAEYVAVCLPAFSLDSAHRDG